MNYFALAVEITNAHAANVTRKLFPIMTKEQLAEMLNGTTADNIGYETCRVAKDSGLLIIFGSKNFVEFRGVFDDQQRVDCGHRILFNKLGLLRYHHSPCGCTFCGYEEALKNETLINVLWGRDGYVSEYYTDTPHACFNLRDGNRKGIVMSASDLA